MEYLSFSKLIFLAIPLGAIITVVVCGIVAYRHKKLFVTDFGTVLVPFIAFYIVGYQRPDFQIGWGLLFGPLITLVLSAYAFGFRVAIIDLLVKKFRVSSFLVFTICITIAMAVAATMKPWYD